MNKNMKTISMILFILGIVGTASMIVMASTIGSIQAATATNIPDLPYVTVCCIQNENYLPSLGDNYGLPVVVNVYDKNMSPAKGYIVNATVGYVSTDVNLYSHGYVLTSTKVTGTEGVARFGFQLSRNSVVNTFGTNCDNFFEECINNDGKGNAIYYPYFKLVVTVKGNGHTHTYQRTFAFSYD
jgi:hypothetical protein